MHRELDMADSVSQEDIEDFIDNAAWTICSTHHTVLKSSPGADIFGRDMMLNIPHIANWAEIRKNIQEQFKHNIDCENAQRAYFDYYVGRQVLVQKGEMLCKAEAVWTGPYCITTVHTNGTIKIQRGCTIRAPE